MRTEASQACGLLQPQCCNPHHLCCRSNDTDTRANVLVKPLPMLLIGNTSVNWFSVNLEPMPGCFALMLLLSMLQLQKDSEWAKWVDLAFAKLDTNDDGYIDLEELIAQLPGMGVGIDERRDSDRLLAVSVQAGVCPASQSGGIRAVWGQGICRGVGGADNLEAR